MLILPRNVGQSLKIGNDVTVTILSVKGINVRIGISAPKSVAVNRDEIHRIIQKHTESQACESAACSTLQQVTAAT